MSFLINPYRFAAPATDPSFSSVSLLLHGDASPIVDSSGTPKTITAFGNAAYSTAQKKFGSGSIAFDGNGDYLISQNPANQLLLSGDFTIECFVWFNSLSSYGTICQSQWQPGGFFLMHHLDQPNRLSFFLWNANSAAATLVQSSTIAINTFYHVAVTRSGNVFRLFVDGVLEASATTSATITLPLLYIGAYTDNGATFALYLNGYIDDLRITKGVARYLANFTPPTAPFPDS